MAGHIAMKAKKVSLIVKLCIVAILIAAAVLKWTGIFTACEISEITVIAFAAYGIAAGTIDANIIVDKFTGGKKNEADKGLPA